MPATVSAHRKRCFRKYGRLSRRKSIITGDDIKNSTLTRRFAPPSPMGRGTGFQVIPPPPGRGWREAPGEGRICDENLNRRKPAGQLPGEAHAIAVLHLHTRQFVPIGSRLYRAGLCTACASKSGFAKDSRAFGGVVSVRECKTANGTPQKFFQLRFTFLDLLALSRWRYRREQRMCHAMRTDLEEIGCCR